MLASVSAGEKKFIREGCSQNIRYDGRGEGDLTLLDVAQNLHYDRTFILGCADFRMISLENNIYPHVNGSARVKIGGDVDIICSVKLEVIQPSSITPSQGSLNISVDISQSTDILKDERNLAAVGSRVAADLQSILYDSNAIDLKSLCIIPGKFAWGIQIDILVLKMDGDILDASSIATFIALSSTKVPQVDVIAGESGDLEDFDVVGFLSGGVDIVTAAVPISITVAKIAGAMVMDPSASEQECSESALCVAVSDDGKCCGITYIKSGLLSTEEFMSMISHAVIGAAAVWLQLKSFLASTAVSGTLDETHPDRPVHRLGLLA